MSFILCTENKYLKQIISLANEEVKELADREDATVDTEDNKKTLIKRYVFLQ